MSNSKTIGDNVHLRKQIQQLNSRIAVLEAERADMVVALQPFADFVEAWSNSLHEGAFKTPGDPLVRANESFPDEPGIYITLGNMKSAWDILHRPERDTQRAVTGSPRMTSAEIDMEEEHGKESQ